MENNNKNESNLFIALKLTLICFVAVVLLSLINFVTEPVIQKNRKKVEDDANKSLIPSGVTFAKKGFRSLQTEDDKANYYYYEVKDQNYSVIGYIVSSVGNGYGGKMKVMVAFDVEYKILNIKLLTNNETPGLGKKAQKDAYMTKFINTNTAANPMPANKNMLSQADKDAITGATITFNGIVGGINRAASLIKKEIRNY